jgi:hypothetical protein
MRVFTSSKAAELLLTVDQATDLPFELCSIYDAANTDNAAPTHSLFLKDHLPPTLDPHLQYEKPNFPLPPQHARRGPVPYDEHPGSSSTIGDSGLSFHAGSNEPQGLDGFKAGTASSEQMLDAGPSLSPAQGQSPTTREASLPYEERLRAKKKRDKIRKRNDRSTNSQDHASICEMLEIPLLPKKTLANRSECQ